MSVVVPFLLLSIVIMSCEMSHSCLTFAMLIIIIIIITSDKIKVVLS